MAKTKAELLKEAKELGLTATEKNTIAEINALIAGISQTPVEPVEKGDIKVAKAGKRSQKALAEAEEKAAKEERKSKTDEDTSAKSAKKPVKPTRSRLERRGKGYRKSSELIEKDKEYSLKEAVELAIKTSYVKFDATVETHVRLNVDPKQADQNIRDSVVLPAGTGKTIKVAVVDDALLAKLEKGEISFDVLIAKPDQMQKLAKYARILGPKGLMPNPKSGTVTQDVDKAVEQAKAGKIEYRVDSTGIIHSPVGKVSFGVDKILENTKAVLDSIKQNRPSSIKGVYVQSITVTTSMGPGIKVQSSEL